MNVVDSSGWLEFFADGPNASFFAKPLADVANLVVPAISVYEVFKRVRQQADESAALESIALMQQGQIVDLDSSTAMDAARVSLELKLPMADAIIYTTAKQYSATLWTQDEDFENVPDVKFIRKRRASA